MFSPKLLRFLAALAMSGFCARGADVATTNAAPAADDYAWLTPQTLPPPGPMIDAAMAALPRTVTEQNDWLKRMHKAAWMPNLELHYAIGESSFNRYVFQPDRKQITTGQQLSQETSSQNGQNATKSTDATSTSYSSGTPPKVTQQRNATSSGSQVENSSSSGSKSGVTTINSVTDTGPGSYALNDGTRWVNQYGIYLTWDLSRILFRQEELSVVQAELNRQTFKDNVRDQVVQTYYDLKEAVLLLQNETYKDSVPTRIRKERLAFLLDTLTAGSFSARAGHKAP